MRKISALALLLLFVSSCSSSAIGASAIAIPATPINSFPNIISAPSSANDSIAPFLERPIDQDYTSLNETHSVVINEVELNSPNGTQWAELFNPTPSALDLTNFTLKTIKNTTIAVAGNAAIGSDSFYLVRFPASVASNIADILFLENPKGAIIDHTPLLIDRTHDLRTWQQVPDGSGEWRFQNQTATQPNDPAHLVNSSSANSQYHQAQNVTAACTGTAGCAEGTVIRISSTNTLYLQVNATIYRIQLALVNATDAHHSVFSAVSIAESYCLGTSALVDQDDKNPVSGENIMATVYCSNANLNQLLLQSGAASLDHAQCNTSEFAGRSWAKSLGC